MPVGSSKDAVWVSVDALAGCIDVASDLGFDAAPYLAKHGIDPDLIASSRGLLSYKALSDCLEDIAKSESCPDFGFQLGRRQQALQFGIISQVLKFAPTVGEAIRIFLRYRDFYSQSSHWDLDVENDVARMKRHQFGPGSHRNAQVVLLSVTRGFEAIRSMIGADWRPIGLYLTIDDVPYAVAMRRFFNAPVFFNSQHDEIAFEAANLDKPIPTGNPEILAALTSHFDSLFPKQIGKGEVSVQVEKQLRLELDQGQSDLASIAERLGMHPRTLQRALAAEGVSFRKLEREMRMETARQMIANSRTPLTDVATSAGYRHLSSFSRAFKRNQGGSPRQYKAGTH